MKSTKDICAIPFVIMKDINGHFEVWAWAKYNISATSRGICHKGVQCYSVSAIQLRNAKIVRFLEEINDVYEKL